MIRKSAVAVTAAAALALGTASATSLGSFDDIAFAASDVDLISCVLDSDAIALLPDLPDPTDATSDPTAFLATATALIGEIQIDLSSLPSVCLDDEVFTLLLTSADDVLASVELTAAEITAGSVGDVLTIDASSLDLDTTLSTVPDIASITQVRMVLSDSL